MLCCSLICWGSSKVACTFWASSWWSLISGTLASSCHQLGVSCTQALQVTHLSYSSTGGSGEDLLLFSSSELPANSWRKQSTSGPNFGRSSRLTSKRGDLASSSSSDSGLLWGGLYWKKGAGSSSGHTWQCLQFCSWDLLWQSWLWEWPPMSDLNQVVDRLSCSIFSSKAAAVARALQWASLASARSLWQKGPSSPS